LRKSRGLTQEKLAELSGIDRTYVPQAESGTRNVSLLTIDKLASALGVDAALLVSDLPCLADEEKQDSGDPS
jgi:transcriptional regulator with XRE-family HTH domain